MDMKRRQLLCRLIEEMEHNAEYAKKLQLENKSRYIKHKVIGDKKKS